MSLSRRSIIGGWFRCRGRGVSSGVFGANVRAALLVRAMGVMIGVAGAQDTSQPGSYVSPSSLEATCSPFALRSPAHLHLLIHNMGCNE